MNRISKFLAAHSFVLLFVYLLLIAGSVQAATVLFPSGGGLGSNAAPTLGKIPVGTSGGVYAPTSIISGPITITGTSTLATTTAILTDKGGQVFNVKAYGAKGNGVTDDTAAFQAADNAAASAGGGTVYVPCTTPYYYIASTFTRANKVHFIGCGQGAELATNQPISIIQVLGGSGSIENITFQVLNNASANGIEYFADTASIVEESLKNVFIGASTVGHYGIYMHRSPGFEMTAMNFENTDVIGFTTSIYNNTPNKLVMTNVVAEQGTTGVYNAGGAITYNNFWFEVLTTGLQAVGSSNNYLLAPKYNSVATRYTATGAFGFNPTVTVVDDTTQNLGIGTSTPARHIDISNSDSLSQIALEDPNASADQHIWGIRSYNGAFNINSIVDALTETTRMIITAAGKVGIGVASPAEMLDVNGSIKLANNNSVKFAGSDGSIRGALSLGTDNKIRLDGLSTLPAGTVVLGTTDSNAVVQDVLTINGLQLTTIAGALTVSSTTATSTFAGGFAKTGIGTSTFANGIKISAGCFYVNGTCLTQGVGSLAATYPLLVTGATGDITISSALGTTSSNTWASTQTFGLTTMNGTSTYANNVSTLWKGTDGAIRGLF